MTYHFLPGDFLSRRALAFSGVAAFHILVAYLLLTALGQPAPRAPDTPLVGVVTQEPQRVLEPLPSQDFRPSAQHTVIEVPPVDQVPVAHEPPLFADVQATDPQAGPRPAEPAGPPSVRLLGANQLPNSEEYYPPQMIRERVQGATSVRVCVDAQGTLQGTPTVEESSGHVLLDRGALNVVRHGRYARSVQGNTPVGNCFRYRIAFTIPK